MKLSIIFVGRNDGYADSNNNEYLRRINLCLQSIEDSLKNVSYEILFFDFCPVEGKKSLEQIIGSRKNINFITFTKDRYDTYVDRCYDNGCEVIDQDKNTVTREHVKKFPYAPHLCYNEGICIAKGEYVLFSPPRNIFPVGLEGIINRLEHGIIYRCKRKNILLEEAEKQFKIGLSSNDYIYTDPRLDKRTNNAWSSAGDFSLMDRESWIEIGGHRPYPMVRAKDIDNFAVFTCLAYKKKICLLSDSYNFISIIANYYNKSIYDNYDFIVHNTFISINHRQEIEEHAFRIFKRNLKFKNYVKNKDIILNNNFRRDIRHTIDKLMNEKIKKFFRKISPDIGTI